jgi:hypothetical protein
MEVFELKALEIIVLALIATWDGSLLSSLKILLFLSSQIFQHKNLGVHTQVVLRRFFLLKLKGERDIHLLRSSEAEVGRVKETDPKRSPQASLEKSQLKRRCSVVSLA